MSKYELLLVVDRDVVEEKREEILNRYKAMIEKDGEIITLDKWGMKKFAYPIKFKNEGFYVLVTFNIKNLALIDEMSKLLNITDGIVRFMFVKKDK